MGNEDFKMLYQEHYKIENKNAELKSNYKMLAGKQVLPYKGQLRFFQPETNNQIKRKKIKIQGNNTQYI